MSDNFVGAAGELQPKYEINFDSPGSLARTALAPVAMNDPVGLVLFGDSSAIYIAHVTDSGSSPYSLLSSIPASTYIHGWSLNSGKLYLLDGIELSYWDVGEGKKLRTLKLLAGTDAATATAALKELQKATQRVEWATLLEQAEAELVKLTAEQAAARPGTPERDRLDRLVANYLKMLKALREMTGGTADGAGSQTLIADLKKALADKRRAAAPWLFSAPLVRPGSLEDALPAVFIMQGNGTIHTCDKLAMEGLSKKVKDQAELQIAWFEDRARSQRLLGLISNSTLYALDPKDYSEKSHWTPTPAPAAGTMHTLRTGNGQFWWSTETGVFALQPNASGVLQPTWKTGAPWAIKQVGRYPNPFTTYTPAVNPNELFDTMNIKAWIAKRSDPNAPLTEGMMAQLFLSNEQGKYVSPAEGKSYLITLPTPGESTVKWADVKPHPTKPLVLVSDSRNATLQCRYPASFGGQQLIPHWTTAAWMNSLPAGSPMDRALGTAWEEPKVRRRYTPEPDMWTAIQNRAGNPHPSALFELRDRATQGILTDRHLRYVIWCVCVNSESYIGLTGHRTQRGDYVACPFPKWAAAVFGYPNIFAKSFGARGKDFGIPGELPSKMAFSNVSPPVNFDPPWTWPPAGPPMDLFHSPPPAWYDPWGYNRPGDFVTDQPSPTFLDPFCFDGNLKFPHRPVKFDDSFKGRSWAVFAENDPASLLANAPSKKDAQPEPEPVVLGAGTEPDTFVVLTDEDQHRSTLQLLPPKFQRIVFDANNHSFQPETTPMGSINKLVVAPPTVFLNPARTFPTAWCVMNTDSPSVRLRKLVTSESGTVPWDQFVDENKTEYGPSGGGKTWKIDICPLPAVALPEVVLDGYGLPLS